MTIATHQVAPPNGTSGENAQALHVSSIGMTVRNVEQSVAFYCDVMGFEHVSERELAGSEFERLTGVPGARARVARMRLGEEVLELTEYVTSRGKPLPQDTQSNDHWFQHAAIIVRNMDEAYDQLCCFGVEHASIAPQRLPDWNPAAGGIHAFYFRDPDGHFLEILQFPLDKGHAKWREPTDAQFLGIDHTAIVISSTEASVHFYRDWLGMRVLGASENYGPEQERLNNVPGARLRITTLRALAGPGIELLEYLAPQTGRPRPVDSRLNDIMHWRTTIAVDGLDNIQVVADQDGHVIELTQLS